MYGRVNAVGLETLTPAGQEAVTFVTAEDLSVDVTRTTEELKASLDRLLASEWRRSLVFNGFSPA